MSSIFNISLPYLEIINLDPFYYHKLMKTFFYTAVLNFFLIASSFAQEPIDLTHHNQSSYIGKHISCFEDKVGTFSIQSIAASPDTLFTSCNTDIINFGFSRSVFWLKFVVKGQDSINNWIMEIRSPDLDSVTFYYKAENGIWKEKNDGDNWPFYKREMNTRNISFKLPQSTGNATEYYIKIKSMGPVTVPVKIEKNDFFISESLKSEVFYGICYGILLIMLFYNLFIYFSIKETSYIFYVLSVASSILFYGLYYGHIPQYITHFKSPVINYLLPLMGSILGITGIQFVKNFLNLAKIAPYFNRLMNILILLYFVNLLILVFIDPVIAPRINAVLAFIAIVLVLIASFTAFKKGNREARFFILAWSFYLISIFIFVLRILGLFPDYEFIMNILLIGSIVEVALQSFALADKINIYRIQKEQALAQIIHLREEDASRLEQKVKERTIQLEHANEEINLINKDLEVFSRTASHDLRAPLRSITGFAVLLEKNSAAVLSEDSKHYLRIIKASSKRMEQLIEDLLAFSRLGKKELVKEEINMKDLVKNIINELKVSQIQEHTININIGSIENSFGDPILLKQVWINLISNAIKYSMKKPKIEIEIGSKTNDNEVTYWVKDNGAGFNMKYVDKLFIAFQRLHIQSEFEGTGLGLSIVKKIITAHGGHVWAESTEGEGATFYFSLPR